MKVPQGMGEGRASGPGLRRFSTAVLLALAGLLGSCGSSTHAANPNDIYGPLPGWLPKSSIPVNRVVVASTKDPKLGIEGDTIKAILSHGQTLITLSGPAVPPFVTPPPPTTTATFTISVSHTSGTVPIRAIDFALVDGIGRFFYPQTFFGARPPKLAPDGKTISFQVREVMATGAGSIRWAPDGVPLATWAFTVEND
jgi:hypothetical protein